MSLHETETPRRQTRHVPGSPLSRPQQELLVSLAGEGELRRERGFLVTSDGRRHPYAVVAGLRRRGMLVQPNCIVPRPHIKLSASGRWHAAALLALEAEERAHAEDCPS